MSVLLMGLLVGLCGHLACRLPLLFFTLVLSLFQLLSLLTSPSALCSHCGPLSFSVYSIMSASPLVPFLLSYFVSQSSEHWLSEK